MVVEEIAVAVAFRRDALVVHVPATMRRFAPDMARDRHRARAA
jgi:hypothetical protein